MSARKGRRIDDPSELAGPEKAAVLLLALGDEQRSVWEQMDDEEIRVVSQAMVGLGNVTANAVEKLIIEFVGSMSSTGSIVGSVEQAHRLLTSFLPEEKVDQIMEELRGPAGRTMWDKLANVNETVLANYLKNEYPQTVSVVLSKVRPDHAASVLAALPEDFALEVVMRMLRMEPVQREIIEKIEETLRNEFMSNLARTSKQDSHELMADIFNNFDRQTENRFLASLEERNRDSAEKIRSLMFVFEDLGKLDPQGVQTLLRQVPKGPAGSGAERRLGHAARHVLLQHVRAGRENPARRHGLAWPGAPQRCRWGATGHGESRQRPRRQGRNPHRRGRR
jgi:flagellar motor switch protein FliG